MAANIKLLLKLVEDQNHNHDHKQDEYGCNNNNNNQKVGAMLAILDKVRSKILVQVGMGSSSKDDGEKLEMMRLKREVKSLRIMCTSLGKEKDIIAAELSKKVQQQSGMDELINDLRTQNQGLMRKLVVPVDCHHHNHNSSSSSSSSSPSIGNGNGLELAERNKMLTEQLLKWVEGYGRMKRSLRVAQEENVRMKEMWVKVGANVERIIKTGPQLPNEDGDGDGDGSIGR